MLMTSCFWGAKPILGRKRITLPEPKLDDIKKNFLENYCPDICHIFYGKKLITHCERLAQVGQKMSIPNLSVPLLVIIVHANNYYE